MKKRFISLLLILLIICLSGCSANFINGGNMMRPPRPTGDKAEIQKIIETKAGSGFTFDYPQSGEYRSAITMQDINNDGIDEAIALFSSGGESAKLNLMIMTKNNGSWKSIGDFTNGASGVDRMFFADINGDSQKELFIGWTSLGNNEKQLTVYAYEDNSIREMTVDSTYSELACADFDNDNKYEFILFTIANSNEGSLAKLFKYSSNEKRSMLSSSIELDSEITRIINITNGMVDSTTRAVFVDGETHNNTLSTQIIFWDSENETLLNPLYSKNKPSESANISIRTTSTMSKDINNDGIIEIPSVVTMPSGDKEDVSTICTLTTWNTYQRKTNSFTGILNMVINYKEGYYFIMPKKWLTSQDNKWPTFITARVDNENRRMTFYEWKSESNNSGYIGDKILTIFVCSQKEWDSEKSKDKIIIRKTDSTIYSAKSESASNELALSENEIKECFKLIA